MIYRVSHVESFRQWRDDEEAETEVLLSKLEGGFEPSEAMKAGTAFHHALELGMEGDEIEIDGYIFHVGCYVELHLPEIREFRQNKTYIVDGLPITISGAVDCLEGLRIEDHKTTARFDPERYFAGYQWRFYLDIFGCDVFRWNVFEMKEYEPMEYGIFNFHRIEQFRYPGLQVDCENLVAEFARFVRTQELALHPPKETQ